MALNKRTKVCGRTYIKTHHVSRGQLDRCRFLRNYRRSNTDAVNRETLKLIHNEIKSGRINPRISNKREFNGKGQIFFERHQTRKQLQVPPLKSTRRCFEKNTQELQFVDVPVARERIFHTCEPIEASSRWDSNNNARRSKSRTQSGPRRFQRNRSKRRKYTLLKVPVKPRLRMMAKSPKSRYRITPCPTENAFRSRVGCRTSYTHSFNRNQSRRGSSYRSFRPRHRTRYRRHVGESRYVIYSRPASIRRRRRRRRKCQCPQNRSRTRSASRTSSAQRRQQSDRKAERPRRRESKSRKSSEASSRHGFLNRVSSMFHDVTKRMSKGRRTSKTRHSTSAKKPKVSKSKASDVSNKSCRGKSGKSRTENNAKGPFVCSIM